MGRLRKELYTRWFVWLVWVTAWPVVILRFVSGLPLQILLVPVWIIGGWFGFIFWGPGRILGRVWGIREARAERMRQQIRETYCVSEEDEEEEEEYDDYLKEEADLLWGYIVNEGGKGGDDYRIVPSDVRRWFPPYVASDGIVTVHEDSLGVGPGWVNPHDPMFGQPRDWRNL